MDENYLDNLMKEASADGKKNSSIEDTINLDAGIDIDLSDIKDISLDELDGLDDLDLSGLELDDIDFDDIDVTKLSRSEADTAEEEDFNLDGIMEEAEKQALAEESGYEAEPISKANLSDDVFSEADNNMTDDLNSEKKTVEEVLPPAQDVPSADNMAGASDGAAADSSDDIDSMDIDDLFSALGIGGDSEEASSDGADSSDEGSSYTAGEADLDSLFEETAKAGLEGGELDDIESIDDVKKKREKRKFSEIIFGVPDEEDLEEERINEQKRAEKKEAKAKKKEEKAAKKSTVLEAKKKEKEGKKKEKENTKKQKQELLKAEAEEAKNEKKVPWTAVIIVFVVFAGIAAAVLFGADNFNYSRIIHKAADYFERQRYHMAYDEVSGVDVKKKDEELRDRIYTVMYVERLYESYENNMAVNRPDKALDALIRGLEKYDEHYDEAVSLGIVEDIDSCRAKIIAALNDTYGISEAAAYEIMELTGQDYTNTLNEYSEALETGE